MKNVFEKVKTFVKEHPVITGVAVTGIVSGITGIVCYELGKNDISNIDVVLDHVPHPTTGVLYQNMQTCVISVKIPIFAKRLTCGIFTIRTS